MAPIPLVRIHGVDDLRLDTVEQPHCGVDDVIVQVRECGICGSDLGYLGMGGLLGPGVPMPLGHELWGEVSEAGANVRHVKRGDRVVVQPMSNGNNIGNGGSEGGFSPYLLVRNAAIAVGSVLRLPPELPEAFGALVEPLAVAQHGVNRVAASAADKAVIYGAGPIGLCMVQVLAYLGLTDTVVVDLADYRLQAASTLGAHAVRADDPQLTEKLIAFHGSGRFFGMRMSRSSLYFEATGVRAVFETMVNTAGPGSRICLTGVHKEPATVDLMMLLAKEVSIIPAMGYDNEFEDVVAMLQGGQIDPTAIVTHHFPLSDIGSAFAMARNTSEAIKVIVDCQA